MRFFILDKYNTWYDWRLTLTAKDVTPAEPKTSYISLDGAHGSLDLSEALTGEVAYSDRTVTASFWTSEGTFNERLRVLQEIVAALHGKKVEIVEPDDPDHFFLGRVKVKSQKWDQVHLELTLEMTCEPWRYAINETERKVEVNGNEVDVVIHNNGVKTLCPVLTVTGSVAVTHDGTTTQLTAGSYKLTSLKLTQGVSIIGVSGTGSLAVTYREAGL
jgi:phage-related protein